LLSGLDKYKGKFPYASELFGVYSPLLGWKSSQSTMRMEREMENSTKLLTTDIMTDILNSSGGIFVPQARDLAVSTDVSSINVDYRPQIRAINDVISAVQNQVIKFVIDNDYFPSKADEWNKIFLSARAAVPGRQ
jgi:hypothetical protein